MAILDIHTYFGSSIVPGVANSAASIVQAMQQRNVDNAVVIAAHARQVDPVAGNRVLNAVLEQGASLYGCLVTHTNRVEASIAVMRDFMSKPKFVSMALVPPHPEEPLDKLVADEILNAYRRYAKPLFIYTPNGACVHAAMEIAKAYPMFKVILLGMGGDDWRTAIAAALSTGNIYLETSGALDRAKLPAAVEAVGMNRLVFGSSSPTVDAAAALGLIQDSILTNEARRRILGANAVRLFELDSANE